MLVKRVIKLFTQSYFRNSSLLIARSPRSITFTAFTKSISMTVRRSARVAAQKTTDPEVAAQKPVDEPPKKKAKSETESDTKTTAVKLEVKPVEATETEQEKDDDLEELKVGDEIPDIILKDQDENDINLKELAKEHKILVVFAYPRASTPGCTRQACGFRDNYPILKESATIVGLSADTPKAQKNFEEKQKLPYRLLSDPKRVFVGALGAKKSPTGVIRSHWIFVDGKLKISKVGISPEQSVNGAKEDVEKLSK